MSGLSGPVPEPGTPVHVSQTGNATAALGGNANTGYQHIEKLILVQPPATERQPPQAPPIPPWAVPRPDELEEVVAAVCAKPGSMVGITTGLAGAGGFGKTMLAEMACADERVREYFAGRVYVVPLGRDVRGPSAIATRVIKAIEFITGHTATYTDPGMAGDELGRMLDQHPGRRTLLVLDDVWDSAQLAPFLRGGRDCVRLVTTRVPAVLPDDATRVRVDQMTQDQAHDLLGQDLELVPQHEDLARDLIIATRRWPLLLRLANRWMQHQVEAGAGVAEAAADMLALLRKEGPAAVDRSHPPPAPPDLDDPVQRRRLVRATLRASIGLLTADQQQRLAELGIFAGGEPVPVLVAARLWQGTAGLSKPESRDVCYELSRLSLLTVNRDGGGFLVLHDVIRDYLRHELGSDRITALNATLTGAVEASLPAAEPLAASGPCPQTAWWALAENHGENPADGYLADHAISHLVAAGRTRQAEAVASDLRWVEARLRHHGPAAPWSDCTRIPTATALDRARSLAQVGHLLAPTDPSHALTAILHSRLEPLADWREQVIARQRQSGQPALRNHWTPPDIPDPALKRTLAGHHGGVDGVAIAPDGTWLATAGEDRTVRIWDPATGRQIALLTGHHGGVDGVAIARDGTWLASTSHGAVGTWTRVTGQETAPLSPYRGSERYSFGEPFTPSVDGRGVAIAPDGTWLATASSDDVCVWDRGLGAEPSLLTGHTKPVTAVAIAPDGTWLASASDDGAVRIWDPATGTQTACLTGHIDKAIAVAIAPDGTWLASTDVEGTVRIWDPATGEQTARIDGGRARAVTIAPDGTWLATGGKDGTVCLWDKASGKKTATLAGYAGRVNAVAVAPDGTWLATAGSDGTVRIWDRAAARANSVRPNPHHLRPPGARRLEDTENPRKAVTTVAVAPDGTWLAIVISNYNGDKVEIYRPSGRQIIFRRPTNGGTAYLGEPMPEVNPVESIAIAPDGTWLATSGYGATGPVNIWDRATGEWRGSPVHVHTAHAVAVAPDGTWLAIAGHTIDGRYGMLQIWNPVTGSGSYLKGHIHEVTAVAIAPDGTWLASAGFDGTLRIWDAATGRQLSCGRAAGATKIAQGDKVYQQSRGHEDPGFRVDDDDDDEYYGPVDFWYAGAGENAFRRYRQVLNAVAVGRDGTWLATAGDDGAVRLWARSTGKETACLTGHRGPVYAVAIAPDDAWIASAGFDRTLRIWEAKSGQALTMMRTEGFLTACAWTPDGTGLVAGGEQGVYFYQLHLGSTLRSHKPAGASQSPPKSSGRTSQNLSTWATCGPQMPDQPL